MRGTEYIHTLGNRATQAIQTFRHNLPIYYQRAKRTYDNVQRGLHTTVDVGRTAIDKLQHVQHALVPEIDPAFNNTAQRGKRLLDRLDEAEKRLVAARQFF